MIPAYCHRVAAPPNSLPLWPQGPVSDVTRACSARVAQYRPVRWRRSRKGAYDRMIDEVEEYVREHRSMVVATNLDGEVRASTTGYALGDEMMLYFMVFEGNVKHRGIVQHPQVSVVIDDGFMVPMRGVEVIGVAEVVKERSERHQAQVLLTRRFPALESIWDDPRILIVRVRADRLRFTDWAHGAGASREASLTPRRAGA